MLEGGKSLSAAAAAANAMGSDSNFDVVAAVAATVMGCAAVAAMAAATDVSVEPTAAVPSHLLVYEERPDKPEGAPRQ